MSIIYINLNVMSIKFLHSPTDAIIY